MLRTVAVGVSVVVAVGGCKGRSKDSHEGAERTPPAAQAPAEFGAKAPEPVVAMDEAKAERHSSTRENEKPRAAPGASTVAEGFGTLGNHKDADKAGKKSDAWNHAEGSEGPTRAWFPETFLFAPLVVTDDTGVATVPVRVPDRLTTWRVLALAHSRSGAQGGATTSFLGTLPAYVDPVIPPFLVIGDEIKLPVQMINTTAAPIASALSIEAENAAVTAARGTRTIPALGSLVEYASLRASNAGTIKLRVGLDGTDAVLRTIEVKPAGKPITSLRSGTLAAPRSVTIEGPVGSDPATDRARLMVFPGALALLRSELGVSTARGGVSDDAYALLLAGRAPALLGSLGDKADPQVLRELSIVTAQRAIRHGRTLDVTRASELVAAALAHPQNPVLGRLGARAAAYLAQHQRPDGTFAGGTGWTLQRVLIATADATRAALASNQTIAAKQRAQAVAVRAAGAFERNVEAVQDGYTAAAILASGAIARGPLAEQLRQRVSGAIKSSADGARYLDVGEGVVRADGTTPGRAEATALAVLALDGDPKAPMADLGTTLLGSYDPLRGWGDGHANQSCIQAVLALFKAPVPANVKITLTMDGKPVTTGTLDRDALRDVLVLEAAAPGIAGPHTWGIVAEPAVPGLGYSLALHSYVPWPAETTQHGLELALPAAIAGTVGKPTAIAITAIAPAGMELHIQHALPAGVQVDRPSLDALVAANTIARFETADGKLDLYVNALAPGQVFSARYKAIPTIAGTLHSAASVIESGPTQFHVPPTRWTIK